MVNKQLYNDILNEETRRYCIHCHAILPWVIQIDESLLKLFVPPQLPPPLPSLTPLAPLPRPEYPKQVDICRDFNCRACHRTVNLSKSATNQISEETTLAPSAWKYPSCNLSLPSLSPSSKPIHIPNLSKELRHHPDQHFEKSSPWPATGLQHWLHWPSLYSRYNWLRRCPMVYQRALPITSCHQPPIFHPPMVLQLMITFPRKIFPSTKLLSIKPPPLPR